MFGPPLILAERMFKKYDTDNSGTIDVREFQALCYNLDHALADEEVALAVRTLDKNGNGQLDKGEFLKWWKLGSRRWAEVEIDGKEAKNRQKAAAAFKNFDQDGSGSIEKKGKQIFRSVNRLKGVIFFSGVIF